jgi:hypothetical protein
MNAYQTSRRQKLADLIANPNVPMKERFESIAGLLEEEIRSAYRRGFRDAAGQRPSALQAGKLQPVPSVSGGQR